MSLPPNLVRYLLDPEEMDTEPTPPVYHVVGLIEEGAVVMLAGDSGTAKSSFAQALAVATVKGDEWLGRRVKQGRVVYIHAEEGPRGATRNLRALGWRSCETALRYWCRVPIRLNTDEGRKWLYAEVESHKADLLVLDSATIVGGIDTNDNAAIAELMGWLGLLALDHNCVVVVTHHETKTLVGTNRSQAAAANAMLGGGQFRAQCDVQISLELTPDPRGQETTVEGAVRDTWRVRLQLPKERQFGDNDGPLFVIKWTQKDEAGALLKMGVRLDGAAPRGNATLGLADRFLAAIQEGGPLERQVCVSLNDGKDNGTVVRALKDSRLARLDDGRFDVA